MEGLLKSELKVEVAHGSLLENFSMFEHHVSRRAEEIRAAKVAKLGKETVVSERLSS